jgi:hypothetical protein
MTERPPNDYRHAGRDLSWVLNFGTVGADAWRLPIGRAACRGRRRPFGSCTSATAVYN